MGARRGLLGHLPTEIARRARSELSSARGPVAVARVARPKEERDRERMNKGERAYADHLNLQIAAGVIVEWHYEGVTLDLGDDCRYTPDFFVVTADGEAELHEVKAPRRGKSEAWHAEPEGRVKVKTAARMYPFRLRVVWPAGPLDLGRWHSEEIQA